MKFVSSIGLLILLVLTACGPAVLPAAPVQVTDPPAAIIATASKEPTQAPAASPVPTATPVPVEEQIYPYYLPLATKLNLAPQIINDVTAKIDWAYVDESRVALQYTISGLDWPAGSTWDAMQVRLTSPTVSDSAIGWGGGGWSSTPVENGRMTGTTDQLFLDGALDAEKHPSMRLRVDIPLNGPSEVGTFHFEFDVPVLDGVKMENIEQTIVANDVSMTLKTLTVNPSRVEALLCFEMPSAVDWGLTASRVTLDGREYPFSGGGLLAGTDGKSFLLTDPERCSTIGFDIGPHQSATSLTLTVPKLMASTPEVIDKERVSRANERLADAGIKFDYANQDHGGNIVVLKQPANATNMEIYPLIWEALADQYEGPWLFTLPIIQ
jgi:hypothetical protein